MASFNSIFEHPSNEVTGTKTVEEVENAEISAKAAVEMRSESPEKMSTEDLGRMKIAEAGEQIRGFKDSLVAGSGRLLEKIKGWGGKALKFGGKLTAIGIGAAFQAPEFVGDKVSEGYNSVIEKYNNGKEALTSRADAAKQKIEGGIQNAKARFQERMAPLKDRVANYLKAREQFNEALRNLRKAKVAVLTTPLSATA
jgi:hypothetical protein